MLVFKPNLVPRSLLMCAKFEENLITRLRFMAVFCKCVKKRRKRKGRKKKQRKWATFWRLIFQEWLTQFTSGLVCVFSRYSSTCTANLVLFGQETTELWTHVKSYFELLFNNYTHVMCARPIVLGRDIPAPAQQIWYCLVKRPRSYERM